MPTTYGCVKCGGLYGNNESHQCSDDTAARRAHLPRRNGSDSVATLPEVVALERAESAMELWPTIEEALGCENCRAIFRRLDNTRCPHCQSESCFDVAAILGRRAVVSVERLRPIVEMLESELAASEEQV